MKIFSVMATIAQLACVCFYGGASAKLMHGRHGRLLCEFAIAGTGAVHLRGGERRLHTLGIVWEK